MGASPSLSQPSAKRFVKQPEKLKIVQHFWSHFMHFCLLVGQCTSSNVCSVSRFCAHPHHSAPWKFVCRFIIAICLFQTGWVPCVALEEGSWTFLLWIQQAKEQRFFSCWKIDGFAACTIDTSSFLALLVLWKLLPQPWRFEGSFACLWLAPCLKLVRSFEFWLHTVATS